MIPKVKAQELVDKMLGKCAADNGEQALILSKQCALIAVDELLSTLTPWAIDERTYWHQVKTEIEKL